MARWGEPTQSLSRKVLEQVVRLGTRDTGWWVYRDAVGDELVGITPRELYHAVCLLVEERDVESAALDHHQVRATLRGWIKYPCDEHLAS